MTGRDVVTGMIWLVGVFVTVLAALLVHDWLIVHYVNGKLAEIGLTS